MTDSVSDTPIFVAEYAGPPPRRLFIARDSEGGSDGTESGWAFICDEWRDGGWYPLFDTWERWFFEILRYPDTYASGHLIWRQEATGELVELSALQPGFDGVAASVGDVPEDLGLEP